MSRRRRRKRTMQAPQPGIFAYLAQGLQGALLACGVLLSHGGPQMPLELALLIVVAAGVQWVYMSNRYRIGPLARKPSEDLIQVYDHLTRVERQEFRTREASLYHWSLFVETLVVVCISGIMLILPIQYALLALVLFPLTSIVYSRYWRGTQIDWFCTTTWAREQSIPSDALRS